MSSRQEEKERRRQQRLAAEQAEHRATKHSTSSSAPPAGSGLLASTGGEASGATVDGIQCQTSEQVLFHIHAHLAVYLDGRPRLVPEGIGIPEPRQVQQTNDGPFVASGACFYWLHSHTRDGIIHIESPVQRTFTLGNYFDLWKQPLSASQVGPTKGPVTAYVNAKRFSGDPRSIPLKAHALIQLDVGTPLIAPAPFTFSPGL